MHYDEQRENDRADFGKHVTANICNKSANKINVIFPYSPSKNQHLTITWHLDEIVKIACADLVKKSKESF